MFLEKNLMNCSPPQLAFHSEIAQFTFLDMESALPEISRRAATTQKIWMLSAPQHEKWWSGDDRYFLAVLTNDYLLLAEITRNNVVPLAEIQPLMNHNAVFLTTFITKTGSTNIMKKLFFKMIRIHNTFFFPNEQQFHIRFKSIRCCKNNTCCTRTMRKNIKFYGRAVPNFNSVTQIKYFFALYYACSSAHSQFLKIIQE